MFTSTILILFALHFLQFYIDCKIKGKEIDMGKKCLCQKHDFEQKVSIILLLSGESLKCAVYSYEKIGQ